MIKNLSVEQSLQQKIAFEMARQGFETKWTEPPKPAAGQKESGPAEQVSIWKALDQKLEEAHNMVRYLSLGVVLFVAALSFLTLADILSHRQTFHNRFFVLGWLIEIGATIFFAGVGGVASGADLDFDHNSVVARVDSARNSSSRRRSFSSFFSYWPVTGSAACGTTTDEHLNIGSRNWQRKKFSKPEPVEIEGPDLQSYKETANDFSRAAVLLIALTVFVSAVCGLGYSYAVSQAGEAAHEALKSVSEMHDRSSRLHTSINHFLLETATLEEHRAQAAVLRQRPSGAAIGEEGSAILAESEAKAHDRYFMKKAEK